MKHLNELVISKLYVMSILGLSSFLIGLLPIQLKKYLTTKNFIISYLQCFSGGILLYITLLHLQPEVRTRFEEYTDFFLHGKVSIADLVPCFGFFLVYSIEEIAHYLSSVHYSLKNTNNNVLLMEISKTEITTDTHLHQHSEDEDDIVLLIKQSLRQFLTVLALSFHAVFEGLAIGLENRVENVWYMFIGLAIHKLILAFCIGLDLFSSKIKKNIGITYIVVFSIVTPFGIGFGMILSNNSHSTNSLSNAILQGIAAGTLLYVVFFEILSREMNNKHSGFKKLFCNIAGFCLMLSIQIFCKSHV